MICKKCKTAVGENDNICQNCGNNLKKGRNMWIVAVILIIAALAVIYFVGKGGNGDNTPGDAIESPEPDFTPPSSEEPKQEETESPEPTESAEPVPSSEADLDRPIEETWEMIDNLIYSVSDYYKNYNETVSFVSKNGYLYDFPAKAYVFPEDLLDLTDMDPKYAEEGALFFFLRPADLKGYGDLRVSDSDELEIFVGYETSEGYAISSESEPGGIIPNKDLKAVLEKYQWEHGSQKKYDKDSDELIKIIDAINRYDDSQKAYDIRRIKADDKYISIVLSEKGQSSALKHYIIEFSGDVYNVILSGIEAETTSEVYVNRSLPDFNMSLLPEYSVSTVSRYLKSDFQNIVEVMRQNELIEESDLPLLFSSGTDEFLYFEFTSGKFFIGYFENDTWQLYLVNGYDDAKNFMESIVNKPPLFILKEF